MLEELVLNPVEFVPELPEISLEALGLSVAVKPGPDYGESSATVERIRQDISEGVTNSRWPPVECTIPLIARGDVDLAIADPLHRLEGWVADVQRRKQGWIRRDFSTDGGFSGSVGTFVDSAGLTPAQGWSFVHQQVATGISLKFTRYPIWFATVEVTKDAEGNPLEAKGVSVRDIQLELADLLGTAPGLITVRLKNEGTEDWRGCYVSLECDSFSDAPTALPKYEAAQLTPKGGAVISAAAAPEVRAVGTVAAGTGAITPGLPSGTVAGDLLIMVAESGGATASAEAAPALTAAGWAEAPNGSEKKGNTRLTVLWKIAEGGDARTTNDTGDHQLARIIGIKAGTFDATAPFNASAKGTQAATKSVSIPGLATTRDKCLIIACASGNLPDSTTTAEFSAEANAVLSSVSERIDNTTAEGDGGALLVATGILALAGPSGYPTTATAVTEAERACISLAVNPIPEAVKCPNLSYGWVTVLESPIGGTEHMTHVDPRRMIFRIDDVSTVLEDVRWKLEWRTLGAAGWNQTMVSSTPLVVSSPVIGNYQLLDLGEARPERPVVGDPRFQWRLQACSVSGSGKQPLIRDVYPMSTEQWARVSDTSPSAIDGEPTKVATSITDGGAETGKTVTWTVTGGVASATISGKLVTTHNLLCESFGFAVPSVATLLDVLAKATVNVTGEGTVTLYVGLLVAGKPVGGTYARIVTPPFSTTLEEVWSQAELASLGITPAVINSSTFGIRLEAEQSVAKSATVQVSLPTVTAPYFEGANENRICFASRSVEFTDTGARRQHITDETWGDVPAPEGMLLKAPAPGQADQDARLLVIPSVGDLDRRADSASIKAGMTVSYRPGFLFSREAAVG